ncbi:UNVERIFIED_CONTAM: hypothetical protein Slati_2701900 [Sesamum latifolium]|uniref:Uncharacterized protein n=1 Tax=Sesamum latifolium TaxID=2727402 RepID=A0AAW2W0I3_9LAMI
MENPNHPSDKKKAVTTPSGTQALQVIAGTPPAPVPAGSTPASLAQVTPSPGLRALQPIHLDGAHLQIRPRRRYPRLC